MELCKHNNTFTKCEKCKTNINQLIKENNVILQAKINALNSIIQDNAQHDGITEVIRQKKVIQYAINIKNKQTQKTQKTKNTIIQVKPIVFNSILRGE